MAEKFNTPLRNALADALGGSFDNGTLAIYSGSQPANAGDSPTGTLLGVISLPADAFAAAVNGSVAKSGVWEDTDADNSGVAGWFRMTGPGGTPRIFDGACGAAGSGEEIELDNVNIVAGGIIRINSFNFTQPAQ